MSSIRLYEQSWSAKEKADFDRDWAAAQPALKKLADLLRDDIETSQRKQRDEVNFSKPAWSEYQAHLLGEQKALYKVLAIIT